jgi:hypothetical protein
MLLQLVTSRHTAFSKSKTFSSFTVPEIFIIAEFTKAHYSFLKIWIQFIYWHIISIRKSPLHPELCLKICLFLSGLQLDTFPIYSPLGKCFHVILFDFFTFIIFVEITKILSSHFIHSLLNFRDLDSNIPLIIFYLLPSINVPFSCSGKYIYVSIRRRCLCFLYSNRKYILLIRIWRCIYHGSVYKTSKIRL